MKKAVAVILVQLMPLVLILPGCFSQQKHSHKNQPLAVVVEKQVFNPSPGVSIAYPVLKGLDSTSVQTAINATLQEKFIGDRDSFKDFHEEENEECPSTYECEFTCQQHHYILAITETGYIYEGGAHGMPFHEVYYIDIRDGTFYQLADLLKSKNNLQELTSLVQSRYEEQKEEIGGFDDAIDTLPEDQSFKMSDNGLEIYFRPYEIAPFVSGFPSFALSWQEVAGLIDTHSDFYQAYFA